MATETRILGFSNQWYKEGMNHILTVDLGEQISVDIFEPPYFLATKFDALKSERHGKDYRWNSDFEDVIYPFDYRIDIFEEI